jgi:hypothetical protein
MIEETPISCWLSKGPGCVHFGHMQVSELSQSRQHAHRVIVSDQLRKHHAASHAAMEHCYAGRAVVTRDNLTPHPMSLLPS